MKWSIRLGRLFGIPVYLHFTFLLLLGFLALEVKDPPWEALEALTGDENASVRLAAGEACCRLGRPERADGPRPEGDAG